MLFSILYIIILQNYEWIESDREERTNIDFMRII
jgi:hypothetical protein